jgi:metal-responsive CopG/Arc/MetJ family transcriptional regulator
MTDEEKVEVLRAAIRRALAARRELKLAKAELKGAMSLAYDSEPEPEPVKVRA